jgi:hypothetical protein
VLLGKLARTGELYAAPDLEALGSLLYRCLFSGAVRALFEREISTALESDRKLHVALEIDPGAAEISALPWEFLFFPPSPLQQTGFFIAERPNLILSRRSHEAQLTRPVTPVDLPLQILGVTDPDLETSGLFYMLGQLSDSHAVITVLRNPDLAEIYDAVNRFKPNVIHLALHFSPEPVSGSLNLLLSNEAGQVTQIGLRDIVRLIGPARSVRLVVLDSCSPALSATAEAGTLGRRMALAAPSAILAVDGRLSTDGRERFFRTLYDDLLRGVPIDEAVQNARIALSIASDRSLWALGAPILYLPGPAGPLTRGSSAPETVPAAGKNEDTGATAAAGNDDHREPQPPSHPTEPAPPQAVEGSLWKRIAAWFKSIFTPGGSSPR